MGRIKWRFLVVMLVFIITVGAMGGLSLQELATTLTLPSSAMPVDNTYQQIFTLELGAVEARDYQRMGSIRSFLAFSPAGDSLVVGTDLGELIVVRVEQPVVLWRKQLGIGKISAVTFSVDGKLLYVGESSPEGNLFCLDSQTGSLLWQVRTVDDIGVDLKQRSFPAVVKLIVRQGYVYVLAMRHQALGRGVSEYHSKFYCFDTSGQPQWVFPTIDSLDAWVNWFSVDDAAKQLVFGTANYSESTIIYDKTLYAVDAINGKLRWGIDIPPIAAAKRTIMRGSPNISDDGSLIAAMASDGRGFAFAADGSLLWQRTLSAPKLINGVYLNAVGRDAYVLDNKVIFCTLNTYNSANWQLPTPIEHPGSNNLVVFDWAGQFITRWQAGGSIEELAVAYPYAVTAVGRNTKTKDTSVHGVYVYHLEQGALNGWVNTAGPAVAAATSANAQIIAGVEVPLKLDDGSIKGSHRLFLAKRVINPK